MKKKMSIDLEGIQIWKMLHSSENACVLMLWAFFCEATLPCVRYINQHKTAEA